MFEDLKAGDIIQRQLIEDDTLTGEQDCPARCPVARLMTREYQLTAQNAIRVRSTQRGDLAITDRERGVRHHFYFDELTRDKVAVFDKEGSMNLGTVTLMYVCAVPWVLDTNASLPHRKKQINNNRNKRAEQGKPDKKYGSRVAKWRKAF